MSEKTEVNHYGLGAFGVLGIIFVLCKIFEIGPIALWSWWIVLMPFWIGLALALAILFIVLLCVFGAVCIAAIFGK